MTPVLQLHGIGKRFGAFEALADVSFAVRERETLGLIGPNGAGKTTLFNVVTGFLRPDTGSVRLLGQPINVLSPAARAGLGLVRTFQKAAVFPALTLRQNLAMATRRQAGVGMSWFGGRRRVAEAEAEAEALIAGSVLAGRADRRLADLSYGEARVADVLVSLALRPRLLLLDEPTAGLAAEEAAHLLDLVRTRHAGATVLIAHDLDLVFGRCDRIAVLGAGRLLCCDVPEAVRRDPAVGSAYLGSLAAAA